jgi:hypothetical protein
MQHRYSNASAPLAQTNLPRYQRFAAVLRASVSGSRAQAATAANNTPARRPAPTLSRCPPAHPKSLLWRQLSAACSCANSHVRKQSRAKCKRRFSKSRSRQNANKPQHALQLLPHGPCTACYTQKQRPLLKGTTAYAEVHAQIVDADVEKGCGVALRNCCSFVAVPSICASPFPAFFAPHREWRRKGP